MCLWISVFTLGNFIMVQSLAFPTQHHASFAMVVSMSFSNLWNHSIIPSYKYYYYNMYNGTCGKGTVFVKFSRKLHCFILICQKEHVRHEKSVKNFEIGLDEHCKHQECKYDFTADINIRSNSGSDVKSCINDMDVEADIVATCQRPL